MKIIKKLIIIALFSGIFVGFAYSAPISQNFQFKYGGGEQHFGSVPNVTHNAILNTPFANDGSQRASRTFLTGEKTFFDEFIGLFTLKDPDPAVKSENWLFYPWSRLIGGYTVTVEPQSESFYEGDTSSTRTLPYTLNLSLSGNSAENAVQLPELAVQDSLTQNTTKTLTINLSQYPEIKLFSLSYIWRSWFEDGGGIYVAGGGGSVDIGFTGFLVNQRCGDDGGVPRNCSMAIEEVSYKNKIATIKYRWNTTRQITNQDYAVFAIPAGFYIAIPPPPQAPTLSLSASPATINNGQSATLSWSSSSATNCSASGGWSGGKSLSGTETITPTRNTTYSLSCSGPGGSISREQAVTVRQIPAVDIKASNSNGPVPLNFNESAIISWSSSNVDSCSVSKNGDVFATGTSGGQSTGNLTSGGTKTYSISCSGPLGSVSDSVVVDVAGPNLSVALSASPLPPAGTTSSYTTALIANVGGTAIGTINYSLWWNCNNSTANVGTASSVCGALPVASVGNCAENSNGVKCEGLNSISLSRPHTFTCPAGGGTCNFKPKIIAERINLSATDDLSTGFGCGGACAGAIGPAGSGTGGGGGGTGTGSGETGTGTGALITILPPPPYFTLSKSGNLEAGVSTNPVADSNKIQLTINPFNLYSADTRLEAIEMPAGATAHFGASGASTANISAPYPKSVDFWLTIPRATAVGGHTIKVRGTGGGVSDTIEIPLNVIQRRAEFREI